MTSREEHIMIVDDHGPNVTLLEKMLKMSGYDHISSYEDPREVVELTAKERPDLLLLDIMMPYIDGIEIIKEVRKNKDTKQLPIIVISAYDDAHAEDTAYELGVLDFVQKPFDIKDLLGRIHSALKQR